MFSSIKQDQNIKLSRESILSVKPGTTSLMEAIANLGPPNFYYATDGSENYSVGAAGDYALGIGYYWTDVDPRKIDFNEVHLRFDKSLLLVNVQYIQKMFPGGPLCPVVLD